MTASGALIGGALRDRRADLGGGHGGGVPGAGPRGRRHSVDCTGPGPACAITVSITGRLPMHAAARRTKPKNAKLGSLSFGVPAGSTAPVRGKLSRKGMRRLKRVRRIKATVRISARRGAQTTARTVRARLQPPRKTRTAKAAGYWDLVGPLLPDQWWRALPNWL
jgi:hypothetical protein